MTCACDDIISCALSEGGLASVEKGGTRRAKRAYISQDEERPSKDINIAVAVEPNRCIRKAIIRVSDSQDGEFDNVTVDLLASLVPLPPTLSRMRQKPPGSMSDMMSAELR